MEQPRRMFRHKPVSDRALGVKARVFSAYQFDTIPETPTWDGVGGSSEADQHTNGQCGRPEQAIHGFSSSPITELPAI
ncbi:MAG TPA: hypothetical protein VJK53_02070 [Candidatus Paceibacterota bacterium]